MIFFSPLCSAEGVSKAKEVVKPFDWTFTTNYMGTTSSRGGAPEWEVNETIINITTIT